MNIQCVSNPIVFTETISTADEGQLVTQTEIYFQKNAEIPFT